MNEFNYCIESKCKKFILKQKELIEKADSTFDAVYDMLVFVSNCSKKCPVYIKEKIKEEVKEND